MKKVARESASWRSEALSPIIVKILLASICPKPMVEEI